MVKIGFLHIPRTGGGYLEGLMCSLGKQYFNFDGSSPFDDQKDNRTQNIVKLGYDSGECERELRDNPNFEKAKYFGGHFSTIIGDVFEEHSISYFTILRDPVLRTSSYVKKLLQAPQFKKYTGEFGSAEFWNNFEKYIELGSNPLLNGFEYSGFSNYMTKAIAGENISDPTLIADEPMFERAKAKLDLMYHVGHYESYETTIKKIHKEFKLNIPYKIFPYKNKYGNLPKHIRELIEDLNKFDIKLFKYSLNL